MSTATDPFWDTLSLDEADYVTVILDDFKDQAWAAPLVVCQIRLGENLIKPGIKPEDPYWLVFPHYDVKNRVSSKQIDLSRELHRAFPRRSAA